jgi:Zn finger protein HypA/HybF involved in hydrogenase expression
MKIVCRCKGCAQTYFGEDVAVEFDFIEEEVRFYCPSCKAKNTLNFESLATKNKRQPLPSTVVMR